MLTRMDAERRAKDEQFRQAQIEKDRVDKIAESRAPLLERVLIAEEKAEPLLGGAVILKVDKISNIAGKVTFVLTFPDGTQQTTEEIRPSEIAEFSYAGRDYIIFVHSSETKTNKAGSEQTAIISVFPNPKNS